MKPRSMEEKISYLLFLMGFAGLLCTAALCIFVFHKAFRAQAWTALEREADLVAAGCTQVDDPKPVEGLCGRLAAHHPYRVGRQRALRVCDGPADGEPSAPP